MILCLCPNPSIDKFIWVEDFKTGKVNRVKKELSYPGGKGVHVALGIAELEEDCAIIGFWGGPAGKWKKRSKEFTTYEVDGKQYVVVAAGGGGCQRTKAGDYYAAFALP